MLELAGSPLQIPGSSIVVLAIVILVIIGLIGAAANFRRYRKGR